MTVFNYLKIKKTCSSGADRWQCPCLIYVRVLCDWITIRQQDNASIESFSEQLDSSWQSFKLVGGKITSNLLLQQEQKDDASSTKQAAQKTMEDKV